MIMKDEELIKKLEETDFPEIEIKSHKAGLRFALLNSDYFKKPDYINIFRKSLAFSVSALAIFVIMGFFVIGPKLTEARVLGIAKNNPEVQKLMKENNMVFSEIKIRGDIAYVLINAPQENKKAEQKNSAIIIQKVEKIDNNVEGAIVELNIKENKIIKINMIRGEEISPLVEGEEESARDIVESEEVVGNIVPKEAKIEKIQSSLPQKIQLFEKDNFVQAVPQPESERKASVHYSLDGKEWAIQVNLDEKRVEKIEYSSSSQINNNQDIFEENKVEEAERSSSSQINNDQNIKQNPKVEIKSLP
jgi:hypothetical protein